ncbi:hypothetical protein [Pleomorphovibrio marinus]|uniref:hypothetical protein n=1 Tax=Pleomorphovibrio marinus TaxID=2164132 RepID=UPI000E0C125C|nr:hypothetical protein [Pleomorphovibrio marinus]
MEIEKKYFKFGVKYGVPLMVIGATIAMKKSKGLGNLLMFAITGPLLLGYAYSLARIKQNYEEL